MYVLAGLILGAVLGAVRAKGRGGNSKDIWQYAAVHAIILGLLGLFLTIFLNRMFA